MYHLLAGLQNKLRMTFFAHKLSRCKNDIFIERPVFQMRKEMMWMVWTFIPFSFVEPAYLIYRINKVCLPTV